MLLKIFALVIRLLVCFFLFFKNMCNFLPLFSLHVNISVMFETGYVYCIFLSRLGTNNDLS